MRALVAALAALALLATACGGDDGDPGAGEEPDPTEAGDASPPATDGTEEDGGAAPADGPEIVVGSFNFPESQILANMYGVALEEAGYPVDHDSALDLGSRELILPDLEAGAIDFLPEYVGSALSVGFGGEATADAQATLEALQAQYDEIGVTALEPAPGQNTNVYVVRPDYAEEHGLTSISDLANVGDTVVLGGAPECETRETCLVGLTETYGLDNIEFQAIQEGPVRVSSLENGQIDLAALFSTQPVISEKGFIALEDDQGITPAENIVPAVNDEVLDAYGEELRSLANSISAEITTEVLLELNAQAEAGEDPEDIARTWLRENAFIEQ